jgi:hypothetical protein
MLSKSREKAPRFQVTVAIAVLFATTRGSNSSFGFRASVNFLKEALRFGSTSQKGTLIILTVCGFSSLGHSNAIKHNFKNKFLQHSFSLYYKSTILYY